MQIENFSHEEGSDICENIDAVKNITDFFMQNLEANHGVIVEKSAE